MIPISERLIISLYDHTSNWAQPYIKAGYPTMLFDKQHEGDLTDFDNLEEWLSGYEGYVYGVLAAPPCDDFAGSGARWWKEKDKNAKRISNSVFMVELVIELVRLFKVYEENFTFWALENPVGRIEKMIPTLKPFRRLIFNPSDYGDPYTKKTILWGEFNNRLPKLPVLPLYGSAIHLMSSKQKDKRSATPAGFAKDFFLANQ
jgi:hypothetical protein